MNCLICQKKTEVRKHTSVLSFVNYLFPEIVTEIEQEEDTYMCYSCFSIYDDDGEMVGVSRTFVNQYGES